MATSVTVVKGDALVDTGAGLFQRATSSTAEVRYVAAEGRVDSGSNDDLLVWVTNGVRFDADTAADPVQTDVGTYADLTDHDTLNESASSNDVFYIEEIVGPATDRKVRGYFVMKTA